MNEEKQPTNTTELAGQSTSTANVQSSSITSTPAPKNTIDLQKFKQSLAAQEDEQPQAQITWKEIKALKRSRYFEKKDNFPKAYLLKHKRTGAIAEVQGASSVHACGFIGWKPRHVTVLEVKDTTAENEKIVEQLEKSEAKISEVAMASSE